MSRSRAIVVVVAAVLVFSVVGTRGVRVPSLNHAPDDSVGADPCTDGDCGQPLFLTPLLAMGKVQEAQSAAKVTLDGYDLPSYSGFLTVNATTDSNLFFWYFPAQNGDPNAPLLLWLQGGPGASSLFGLFGENGPVRVAANGSIVRRDLTWNQKYSMVYFDSPVGAGFSFTNSSDGYTFTEDEVSADLYTALTQFFTMFPNELANDFYVTGESYGGKYVPATSYKIHMENQAIRARRAQRGGAEAGKHAIKLTGLAIGDGWCDPESQVPTYPDSMFNQGLIDSAQRAVVKTHMDNTLALIAQGKYVEAYLAWDLVWGDDPLPYPSLFTNWTGSTDTTNFLRTEVPAAYVSFGPLIGTAAFHKAIHVGAMPFGKNGGLVYHNMQSDFMHTISPLMTSLMDKYKVLVYNGQVDPILGPATGDAFISSLTWSGSAAWPTAPRTVWRVTDDSSDVAGFVKCIGNVFQAIVRGAGHFVPADQPVRAYDMIARFVDGTTAGFCDA